MNNVEILDTTLRDGGFAVNFNFGKSTIWNVIKGLVESGIDFIEIGYLDYSKKDNENSTFFHSIKNIPFFYGNLLLMIDYGKYPISEISISSVSAIKTIRLAFYKRDCKAALEYAKLLQNKGYKLCIQIMITTDYSEQELIELIDQINIFDVPPIAVYIVDSYGRMTKRGLLELIDLFDKRLNTFIKLGIHLHNGIGFSYDIFKDISQNIERKFIIDSSLLGIGKGTGNISTEILAKLIDSEKKYNISLLYELIDQYIVNLLPLDYYKTKHKYVLVAQYNCSPTYIKYYSEQYKLNTNEISHMINMMDNEKQAFNKQYADDIYRIYNRQITMNTIERAWNEMAEKYDDFHSIDYKKMEVWKNFIKVQLGTKPIRVLDVGTGTGFLAGLCCELGYQCEGIDISKKMISFAQKKALKKKQNIIYSTFDGLAYDYSDCTFDAIVSSRVLWTLLEPEKVIMEWYRILKPNGTVLAFTSFCNPNKKSQKLCYGKDFDYSHFFFKYCSKEEALNVFKIVGFIDVHAIPFGREKNDISVYGSHCIVARKIN